MDASSESQQQLRYQVRTSKSSLMLRMSRSFGDFYLKQNSSLGPEQQAVTAVPEVIVHTRSSRSPTQIIS